MEPPTSGEAGGSNKTCVMQRLNLAVRMYNGMS